MRARISPINVLTKSSSPQTLALGHGGLTRLAWTGGWILKERGRGKGVGVEGSSPELVVLILFSGVSFLSCTPTRAGIGEEMTLQQTGSVLAISGEVGVRRRSRPPRCKY